MSSPPPPGEPLEWRSPTSDVFGRPPRHLADPPPADRQRRGRLLAWLVIAVVVAAAAGVLQLTGGLDPVAAAPTPSATGLRVAKVGETINVGPATIRIDRVIAIIDLGPGRPAPDEGKRFVAVVAHAEVTDHKTFGQAYELLQTVGLSGVQDKPPVPVYLRDSQAVWGLQPGLPEDITWLFEQPLSVPLPATVTVEVNCAALFEGVWTWSHKTACARVEVPVTDRTSPTPTASASVVKQ